MKDFISKEMSRILEDSSSGYEFPMEYFSGPVSSYGNLPAVYSSGYKSSITRNENEELYPAYLIENEKNKLEDEVSKSRAALGSSGP
jgi:hypothetical protein